ncbi:enoyl-hydratase [Xylariaceae sp. FL0804]|nr:enoyl-hydratase [Xylariaceae sp. FL0804]
MAGPSYTTKLPPGLAAPPPPVADVRVAFPAPHVLLVTLDRPEQLNAIPRPQHFALERLWDWYDEEPSLRCAVFTGSGRAFCAGADLKEWDSINSGDSGDGVAAGPGPEAAQSPKLRRPRRDVPSSRFPPSGFGGLSNRGGVKPVIAAVNGICFGGGMEMAINCDMVVAAAGATFGLPEVTIGVIALAGALPRLVRSVGRQRAAEMALGGGRYGARQMLAWGLVNEVVEEGGDVVDAALKWAVKIAGNSPDSVIVSREGLKLGWEGVGPEQGTDVLIKGWYGRIEKGDNMVEGVKSFVERRKPVWKDSKL